MAIRIRKVKSKTATGGFHYVALCAAETKPKKDDLYLDDGIHEALSNKFHADFETMGFIKEKEKK